MIYTRRDLILVAVAGVLAVNVAVAFHFYASGKQAVALKSTRDSLSVVVAQKKVIERARDSIGAELKAASAKSAETRIVYVAAKNNVKVKGDSAYDSTGHFIQVLDPRITQRIQAADLHVANLESELVKAKSLIRVDTVLVSKQGEETKLNQHIAQMVTGSRFTHGLEAGVGVCYGAFGKTPCAYVGYGVAVRFP